MVTEATAKALEAESWGNETKGETLERLWNTQLRYFFWEHYLGALSQELEAEMNGRLGLGDEAEASDSR